MRKRFKKLTDPVRKIKFSNKINLIYVYAVMRLGSLLEHINCPILYTFNL